MLESLAETTVRVLVLGDVEKGVVDVAIGVAGGDGVGDIQSSNSDVIGDQQRVPLTFV